jgi:2-methylcitrate dehydratase PrpD
MAAQRAAEGGLVEFISELTLADVPDRVRDRLRLLLADLGAVCVAGRAAPAARVGAEHARALHPADEATALVDGGRLGVTGAAFANAVLANVLDLDDGHRLTKGHPGAIVIPAALAVAQFVDASPERFEEAVVVGYEVAIRAGIALHARDPSYHASGAWGALGAAAAAARLLALDRTATRTALGLAEYHAPMAPIMRSCAEPAMTKDACAWGASLGVESALLAARGFTTVRAEFLDGAFDDLGRRWRLEELYIKAYPCCRWSQAAIAATLQARREAGPLEPAAVERVTVRTFEAAAALAEVVPQDTEQAQYNLVWPVACALARGGFGVGEVLGPFDDPAVRAIFERVEIEVDPELTAAFPARRLTAVELAVHDRAPVRVGPREAPGEPDDPRLRELVIAKVAALVDPGRDVAPYQAGGGIGSADARALIGMLCEHALAPPRGATDAALSATASSSATR